MADTPKTRRVAVVARGEQADRLRDLFRAPPLRDWQPVPAGTCEQARFLAQMDACDVLVVDEGVVEPGGGCLGWLAARPDVPVLFVSEADAEVVAAALAQ